MYSANSLHLGIMSNLSSFISWYLYKPRTVCINIASAEHQNTNRSYCLLELHLHVSCLFFATQNQKNEWCQFLLPCGIWETGGHNLHMSCLPVITFSPRLMTGNGSLGGDESHRQASQVVEHENGIFKEQESQPPSMCFYFQRAIKRWGQRGLDFKHPVSSGIPLK